jgi:hypothetical protein
MLASTTLIDASILALGSSCLSVAIFVFTAIQSFKLFIIFTALDSSDSFAICSSIPLHRNFIYQRNIRHSIA